MFVEDGGFTVGTRFEMTFRKDVFSRLRVFRNLEGAGKTAGERADCPAEGTDGK